MPTRGRPNSTPEKSWVALRQWRLGKGYTQKQAATRLGKALNRNLAVGTYQKWEYGRFPPVRTYNSVLDFISNDIAS